MQTMEQNCTSLKAIYKGSHKVSKCLFSKKTQPFPIPLNLLNAVHSFLYQICLLQFCFNHNFWKQKGNLLVTADQDAVAVFTFRVHLRPKKFHLSNTHLLACHTWGCEQGRACPASSPTPKPSKSLSVNMHVDNTSKWRHTKINREDKQPFFL